MNIREYMDNPLGKGATIPGKQFIVEDYNNRFHKLVMEKEIQMNVFISGNRYFYHFLIPTESDKRDNNYDIVIELSSNEKHSLIDNSLLNYDIKFFSNCPSFTYTYAYAYNMNGLLIPELGKLYEDIVLKRPPVSRNPGIITNYEKSIFFACKYILDDKNLLDKKYINKIASKLPRDYFKKQIRTSSKIEYEIKASRAKFIIDKKDKNKNAVSRTNRDFGEKRIKSTAKGVNRIKSTNKITASKSTGKSSVGTVNRIKPKKR